MTRFGGGSGDEVHIDHAQPIVGGGVGSRDNPQPHANLRLLHARCNRDQRVYRRDLPEGLEVGVSARSRAISGHTCDRLMASTSA